MLENFIKNSRLSYMKIIPKSKIWFLISITLVVASIVLLFMGGLKLGIDFSSGTLVEFSFKDKPSIEQFTSSFDAIGKSGQKITETDDGFIVRAHEFTPQDKDALMANLKENGFSFEIERSVSVGPTVGKVFKKQALTALIVAIIAIILFIAFSFRKVPKHISPWKFGISAIIALVHDVLITIGVFALLGLIYDIEIDALFITALLTVMGFSVHDTIVVFDRLRENLKKEQSLKRFSNVAEKALQDTMARSINTSVSTIIVLLALLFLGSETLFFFLLALIVGIIAGTWSSIFIATPLLVAWQNKKSS
jgi:preprotein translocase subunit SecF